MDYYILKNKVPVKTLDISEWGNLFGSEDRTVVKTNLDNVEVSTVFLGLDHQWRGNGPPLLFETMVFGGEFDGEQDRYSTWDEAVEGHNQMVKMISK